MNRNKLILFGLLTLATLFIVGCSGSQFPKESTDKLASCLVEKNVKEYGAFWCPNCAKQAQMFGKSMSILKEQGVYVECDPRCDNAQDKLPAACHGIVGNPRLCLEKGVDKYPNWQFPNGEKLVGIQDLSQLAATAGCDFP